MLWTLLACVFVEVSFSYAIYTAVQYLKMYYNVTFALQRDFVVKLCICTIV